jgi:PRTRC genetic system protein D
MNTLVSVGLDTGYGAVKARAVNQDRSTLTCNFESLVAKILAPSKEEKGALKTWQVCDDGQWFQANGGAADHGYRSTTSTYFRTPEYRALTKIMICVIAERAKATTIDTLVLGLPVNQFAMPQNRQILIDCFQGEQHVFHGGIQQTVLVKKVIVVPQPVGTLTQFVNPQEPGLQFPSKLSVLDVGNGTSDFITSESLQVDSDASRSVHHAMAELRVDLARSLSKQGFYDITAEKINDFFLERPTFINGNLLKRKDIQKHLDQAVDRLVKKILNELPTIENTTLLLAGAAAVLLQPAFKRELSSSVDLRVVHDPAFCNASGFSIIGMQS